MGEANSIIEATKFMFMGLGVVFFLLILAVYVFKMQDVILSMFFKINIEDNLKTTTQSKESSVVDRIDSNESIDEKQLTAVIAAALQYHDNSNKQIVAAIMAAILHHNNKGE